MMLKHVVTLITILLISGCSSLVLQPQPSSVNSQQATAGSTGVSAVDKLIAKGDAQRRQGDYRNAAATLERALRLAPQSGGAYLALSRVRLDQKSYGEALQLAEKSLSLSADSKRAQKEAWLVISEVKKRRGDVNGSLEAAKKARRL